MDMKKQLEANLLKCLQKLHIEYRQRIISGFHSSGSSNAVAVLGGKSSTLSTLPATSSTEELFTLIHAISAPSPALITNNDPLQSPSPSQGEGAEGEGGPKEVVSKRTKKRQM